MRPGLRFALVFSLGFLACTVVGWVSVRSLEEADATWQELQGDIYRQRAEAARLDPTEEPAFAEWIESLDRLSLQAEARRDEIANSLWIRILISVLSTAIAYWIAVLVASRVVPISTPATEESSRAPAGRKTRSRREPGSDPSGSPDHELHPEPTALVPHAREDRVFLADGSGVLRFVSDAIVRDLGLPRSSLVGRPVETLFAEAGDGPIGEVLASLSPQRATARFEIEIGPMGDSRRIALRMHARYDETGALTELEGHGHDLDDPPSVVRPGPSESADSILAGTDTAGGAPEHEGSLSPSEDPEETAAPGRSLAGVRVLVAEPDVDQRRLIRFLLTQLGVAVTAVPDGVAAIEATDGAGPDRFDLVLLDPRLPRLDGQQVLLALRTRGYDRPVVALTRSSSPHERERCLGAGFDEAVSKPIDRRTLVRTLASVLPELDITG